MKRDPHSPANLALGSWDILDGVDKTTTTVHVDAPRLRIDQPAPEPVLARDVVHSYPQPRITPSAWREWVALAGIALALLAAVVIL